MQSALSKLQHPTSAVEDYVAKIQFLIQVRAYSSGNKIQFLIQVRAYSSSAKIQFLIQVSVQACN